MPCVYILTNPVIPGLLKIGYTGGAPHERAAEISRGTGVPSPYKVEWFIETTTTELAYEVEQAVHTTLATYRHNQAREFFTATLAHAIDSIERIAFQKAAIASDLNAISRLIEEEKSLAYFNRRNELQRLRGIEIENSKKEALQKRKATSRDEMYEIEFSKSNGPLKIIAGTSLGMDAFYGKIPEILNKYDHFVDKAISSEEWIDWKNWAIKKHDEINKENNFKNKKYMKN